MAFPLNRESHIGHPLDFLLAFKIFFFKFENNLKLKKLKKAKKANKFKLNT